MKERLFIMLQYLLPHHLLSRMVGKLAECRVRWLKNLLIKLFIRCFKVDMNEASVGHAEGYEHFNAFFTRTLKPGLRSPQGGADSVLSPCDGTLSQLGTIQQGRIFQAKGHSFSLTDLLGGDPNHAADFMGGQFATVYLSPKDYHRIHMPQEGVLREMIYVPGRLFSVNPTTTEHVPELFARNERLVCLFDTPQGPMAMVLVGAMIVASIETVWAGLVTPVRRCIQRSRYDAAARQPITLAQSSEMGRFQLGSTVILLFGPGQMRWTSDLSAQDPVRLGQVLGQNALSPNHAL